MNLLTHPKAAGGSGGACRRQWHPDASQDGKLTPPGVTRKSRETPKRWPDAPSEWTPSVTGGDAPEDVRTFFPNPKMSYANSYGYPGLHPDDITGISLLYPAAGFLEGAGTIRGRIVFADGSPASFAVVSSADAGRPGSPFGPHTFTDAHGQFVLEGLRPGRTMLWIHPYLVPAGKAFSSTDVATPAMHHTMIWPLVEAGKTLDLGEIRVTRDDRDMP